jgi:peptidoglycan/LPS O-acetylase OafA/YrhL
VTAAGLPALSVFVANLCASGVDLFFVLSGVVLARPYARLGRPFQLASYLRRRARRLLPPYLLAWLLTGLAIHHLTAHPTWWTRSAHTPPFRLSDWFLQIGVLNLGAPPWNLAWWSLNVEVAFYLLIPVLIPALVKLPSRIDAAMAVLAGSVLLAALVPLLLPGGLGALPGAIAGLIQFAPCFAAGLLLARLDLPASLARGLVLVGLCLVVVACHWTSLSPSVGYGLIYAGVVSRALDPGSALARPLGAWHLVWLGERSYSLFLIHWTIWVLILHTASRLVHGHLAFVILTRAVALPLFLLAAMLLFQFSERRFAWGLTTKESFWPRRRRDAAVSELAA